MEMWKMIDKFIEALQKSNPNNMWVKVSSFVTSFDVH